MNHYLLKKWAIIIAILVGVSPVLAPAQDAVSPRAVSEQARLNRANRQIRDAVSPRAVSEQARLNLANLQKDMHELHIQLPGTPLVEIIGRDVRPLVTHMMRGNMPTCRFIAAVFQSRSTDIALLTRKSKYLEAHMAARIAAVYPAIYDVAKIVFKELLSQGLAPRPEVLRVFREIMASLRQEEALFNEIATRTRRS